MSIDTAFYKIAKNVTAIDLAKIIGAKIMGLKPRRMKWALSKI